MKNVYGIITFLFTMGLMGISTAADARSYYLQQRLPADMPPDRIEQVTFTFFDSADSITPILRQTYFSEALRFGKIAGGNELQMTFDDIAELADDNSIWVQTSIDGIPREGRIALAGAPTNRISLKSDGAAYVDIDRGLDEGAGIIFREAGGDRAQWIFPFFRGWQNDNLIFRWDVLGSLKDVMFLEAVTGNVGIGYDNSISLSNKLQVNGSVLVTGAMKTALPTPGFDSGWQACTPTTEMQLAHALNVPVDTMVVDFMVKNGTDIRSPTGSANYWTKLTSSAISVNCTFDEIRIRIWAYK